MNLFKTAGQDSKTFGENLKTAAGAIFDFGKGTYTEMMHKVADDSEYVLQDKQFDIVNGANIKSIPYERVVSIQMKGDKTTFLLDKGSVAVKPVAYIVAGKAKVPVGWVRNGIEVPFELLIMELAARCGLEVKEEA